jgi:hypothetical protein
MFPYPDVDEVMGGCGLYGGKLIDYIIESYYNSK